MPDNETMSMSVPISWSGSDPSANLILSPLPSDSHPIFTVSFESLCEDPMILASLTILETEQLLVFRGHAIYNALVIH